MNWQKLKTKVSSGKADFQKRLQNAVLTKENNKNTDNNSDIHLNDKSVDIILRKLPDKVKSQYVGLDCEMVGIGPNGKTSALARCCVVDCQGNVLYDEFVRPPGYVTDFRTKWSGVRRQDLRKGEAVTLQECQSKVAQLLKGKILVGHALKNDMTVLMLSHPRRMIRDTATYRPLMRVHGTKYRPKSLKNLSQEHLHETIQTGEHDPSEDARMAMKLYLLHRDEWEKSLLEASKLAKQKAYQKSHPDHDNIATANTISDDHHQDNENEQDEGDVEDEEDEEEADVSDIKKTKESYSMTTTVHSSSSSSSSSHSLNTSSTIELVHSKTNINHKRSRSENKVDNIQDRSIKGGKNNIENTSNVYHDNQYEKNNKKMKISTHTSIQQVVKNDPLPRTINTKKNNSSSNTLLSKRGMFSTETRDMYGKKLKSFHQI